MTISYSDQPLLVPTPELISWIYNNIDPNDIVPWVTRAFPGAKYTNLTWPTGYWVPRKIQIGRLIWPSSASKWAYGFFLMDAQILDTVLTQVFGGGGNLFMPRPLLIDSYDPEDPLYEELSIEEMWLLSYFPLSSVVLNAGGYFSQYLQNKINNLYMIILVDTRYYWWNYSTGALSINNTTTSWSSLFQQIAGILGVQINVDTINPKYLNAHKCLSLPYEVVPPFLDALAYNVGQRIFVDFDGHVFTQNFKTAQTSRQNDDKNHPDRPLRAGNYFYPDKL